MHFWWVNQNQTYKHEIEGGYMWSPKKRKDGGRNVYYDNMTKVQPGDIVFSFIKTKIQYVGVIKSHGYAQSRPAFGSADALWDKEGWMVNVDYRKIRNQIKPAKYIDQIRPLLPNKYSPLQENGRGLQNVYLASINDDLGNKLLELIGEERDNIISESEEHQGEIKTDQEAEEDVLEQNIRKRKDISETEKETVVKARKGQGRFREDVISLHKKCPLTGIDNPILLKASHLKPWSKCESNQERVDPLNGLPLTPTADHLVDSGFISFDVDGTIIFSKEISKNELVALGIDPNKEYKVKIIDKRQVDYLKYHREHIYKK